MRWGLLLLLGCCVGCVEAREPPILLRVGHDLDRDVGHDVALGYEVYKDSLSPYGDWRSTDTHVVEWCPDGGFVPFRTDGRWIHEGKNIRWHSNANDWRNATTHSGNWILE